MDLICNKKAFNYYCEPWNGRIRCTTCKKEFRYHTSLLQHKYIHHKLMYNCPWCERGFYFLSQLRILHNIHLKLCKYKCDFKNYKKKLTWPHDLSRYKKLILTKVTNVKHEFKCKEKWLVVEHSKGHGPHRYTCGNCDQSFKNRQKFKHYKICNNN